MQGFYLLPAIFLAPIIPRMGFYGLKHKAFLLFRIHYLQEITEASALTRELAALFIQDVQIGERDDKTGAQEIKIDWLI